MISYLYRCDVIKCSCDVMHTECDVIECVMSYSECVLYHRYSGCDHTDTDMKSVMSYIEVVLS